MRVSLGHKGRYHFSETSELERDELLMAILGGIRVTQAAQSPASIEG
jgi:hypothetical protein